MIIFIFYYFYVVDYGAKGQGLQERESDHYFYFFFFLPVSEGKRGDHGRSHAQPPNHPRVPDVGHAPRVLLKRLR